MRKSAWILFAAGVGSLSVSAAAAALAPNPAFAYFPTASFSSASYSQNKPDPGEMLAYDAVGGYNGGWSAFYPDGSWYGIGSYITGPDGTMATSSAVSAAQLGFTPTTTLGAYTLVIVMGENLNVAACLSPGATLSSCLDWAKWNAYTATLTVDPPVVDPPAIDPPNQKYSFGGFLSPLMIGNPPIYKRGRTLPVKFTISDADSGAAAPGVAARLRIAPISGGTVGPFEPAVSTSASAADGKFRYDEDANEYVFNLDTLPMPVGAWRLVVDLDDGTSYSADIILR